MELGPEDVSLLERCPHFRGYGYMYVLQVRVELLLELALSARRPVLLTGPQGSGKTTICKHFLQDRGTLYVHVCTLS